MPTGLLCYIRQRHLSTLIRYTSPGIESKKLTPLNTRCDDPIEVGTRGENDYSEVSEST